MSDAPIFYMTRRPLCREYLLARFGSLKVQAQGDEGGQGIPVRWALGALANRELEVLGLWLGVKENESPWPQISSDLRVAGVERIRFISTTEPDGLREEFPDAEALPPLELCRSGSPAPMAASLRRAIGLAESGFQQVHASLTGLAKKHGRFATREAAVSILTRKLDDAERRLARQQAMLNGGSPIRRTASRSTFSAQV